MFDLRTTSALALASLVLAGPFAGALAQTANEGSAVVKSISACREIADEAERFACYDRVAGAIGKGETAIDQATKPPSVQERQEAQRKEFGKPAAPPPVARAAPPRRQAEAQRPVDTRVKQVVAKLEHISLTPDGRLLIVTDRDGAWVQTDHERFQNLPRPGAEIMIRRSPIGNYMCDIDRWHAARCRRLD